MFYTFIITSYIIHAPIGFGLESRLGMDPNSYLVSYIIAGALSLLYGWYTLKLAESRKEYILKTVLS
jgi:hypothetical protein